MQQGRIRKKHYERHNSLERAIRGAKNLERLEKNRKKMDKEKLKRITTIHHRDMLMKSKEENDKSHDRIVRSIIDEYNKQAADSQSSYSSDSFRSSVSLANRSRDSYDYSSDEDQ
jgi:hypothetical protein